MRSLPVAIAIALGMGVSITPAAAGGFGSFQMRSSQPPLSKAKRAFEFNLPTDFQPQRPMDGLSASIAISPGATIGFGRFYAPPRKRVSVQDQPITLEPKRTRRTAVGLSLRF